MYPYGRLTTFLGGVVTNMIHIRDSNIANGYYYFEWSKWLLFNYSPNPIFNSPNLSFSWTNLSKLLV